MNILSLFTKKSDALPLINHALDLYPEATLEDTRLIACQHLLGSTFTMFEALFKKGLKPENTYLLGKCYSTNEKVYQKFIQRGVNISPLSKAFDSRMSFDEQFQSYIESFIKEIEVSKDQKVILLDDGANLILFANDFFRGHKRISAVEQTSSGYEKLKNVKLNFPVINVARSEAKLKLESPMIAEVALAKIEACFKKKKLTGPKTLIVGQGSIGKALHYLLKDKYDVEVYDLLTHEMHFPGSFESRLKEFDVIIGATGQSIIIPGDFGKLKQDVMLISVSSSDREFSGAYLRRLNSVTDNCHIDYSVNGINLLNSGFPINFDGGEHSVSPQKIQLTRSLLLSAVLEASQLKDKRGLIELSAKIQKLLIDKFLNI